MTGGNLTIRQGRTVEMRGRRAAVRPVEWVVAPFGLFLHVLAYSSLLPAFAAGLVFAFGYGVLRLSPLGGAIERRMYNRMFATGLLAAGVAAAYATFLHDGVQLNGDPAAFFELASRGATGLSISEIQLLTEGSLALVLWHEAYTVFGAMGFPAERYVGILLNVLTVAFSGVVTVKMARRAFGDDSERLRMLARLYPACGLFWLFAGIHLRDATILLLVAVLMYEWVRFLCSPGLTLRLVRLVALSSVASVCLALLRTEFIFVPGAMAVAGTVALILSRKARGTKTTVLFVAAIGIIGAVAALFVFASDVQVMLMDDHEAYSELAREASSTSSLGLALIANQPALIRVVLGSIYLFVFPIPFWAGAQESAYALFKSLNALFFYFVIPLLILTFRRLWNVRRERTPPVMFLLFFSVGFTIAIAMTSVETRHIGAFLPGVLVLSLLPDMSTVAGRHSYKQMLFVVLSSATVVHALWAFLKL